MSHKRALGEKSFFWMYGREPILPEEAKIEGTLLNQRMVKSESRKTIKAVTTKIKEIAFKIVDLVM